MKRVLFICTHNSARSQMAEAFLRRLYGDRYESYSAGTVATQVNPYAIKVMEEIGIPMDSHRSKNIDEFRNERFDVVATVCDDAKETCPFFPGAERFIHKSFEDPSSFHITRSANRITQVSEEEILNVFRRVRDEIREWVEEEFSRK